jgi:transposase
MRKTISVDLRERILASYDNDEGTRPEIANRYRVSLGLVKKLLQQRRRTGDIAPRHRFSGRRPKIQPGHHRQMRALLVKKPDMTLEELRDAISLDCTLPAIHYVLEKMGLTFKKRRSGPASKTARTSPGRVASGGGASKASIRRGLSSSTNRGRKRT